MHSDITRLGDHTAHRGLCAPDAEMRREPWCAMLESCPVLKDFGIRHLGIVHASKGYEFVREDPRETTFLACLGGEGRVFLKSEWNIVDRGKGVLLPKHQSLAYLHHADSGPWTLAWICFGNEAPFRPGSAGSLFTVNAGVFLHLFESLFRSWRSYRNDASAMSLVSAAIELVKVHSATRPELELFRKAWATVSGDLARDWDVNGISRLCACSREQLRRLCLAEFGTSPLRHLTRLRLQECKRRLLALPSTLDAIAADLGYSDAFALSHAFARRFGITPARFRALAKGR